MLMNRETSSLLVVDVQERLLPSIADGEAVLATASGWRAWPGGWGAGGGVRAVSGRPRPTAASLLAAAGDAPLVTKTHFCVADGCLTAPPSSSAARWWWWAPRPTSA
jgi:hypothetical protein